MATIAQPFEMAELWASQHSEFRQAVSLLKASCCVRGAAQCAATRSLVKRRLRARDATDLRARGPFAVGFTYC